MSDHRRQYDERGFVHLPQVFSAIETGRLRNAVGRYMWEVAPKLDHRAKVLRFDDPKQVCKLEHMNHRDPFFEDLLGDLRLVGLASELFGTAAAGDIVRFQNALPHGAGDIVPHQDAFGPNLDPALSLTFWVSLGRYGERDGRLRYLPGSHKGRYQPALHGPLPNPDYDTEREIAVPTEIGDLIAHDGFTVHRSGFNLGDAER